MFYIVFTFILVGISSGKQTIFNDEIIPTSNQNYIYNLFMISFGNAVLTTMKYLSFLTQKY